MAAVNKRQCFRKDGRAKRPLSKRRAFAEARRHRKKAYQCKICGKWHIGG